MVTSGSRAAYETALRSIRKAGTLAIVGMAPEAVPLDRGHGSGEYRIIGSAVGSREELREVLQLAAEGKVKCRTETRQINVRHTEMTVRISTASGSERSLRSVARSLPLNEIKARYLLALNLDAELIDLHGYKK